MIPNSPSPRWEALAGALRRTRTDIAVGLVFLLAGLLVTYVVAGQLDPRYRSFTGWDVWFEADVTRVYDNLVDRYSNYARLKTHPLYGLLTFPPVFFLRKVLGVPDYDAVRVLLGTVAGIWLALLYATLRVMSCRRTDAALFTLLGATSAAAMFWFPMPETHVVASLTMVLALLITAVSLHRKVPEWVDVGMSAASLGATVTNWMAGVWSVVLRRPWLRAVRVSVLGFLTVVALWVIAKQVMPSTFFFLGQPPDPEQILAPEQRGPLHIAASMFIHTVVMPAIWVVDRPGPSHWPVMITQPSALTFASPWGAAAALIWLCLLGAGVWSLFTLKGLRTVRLFLGGVLAGQAALHLIFGIETFLYAANWLPLFIALAALGSLTRLRRPVVAAAVLLLLTGAVNNVGQWRRANGFFHAFEGWYYAGVAEAQKTRPADPWPDSARGYPLALPGTGYYDKGFFVRSGSFSPGFEQFSVAIWTLDASGGLRETTDHSGVNTAPPPPFRLGIPADSLPVTTSAYRATWAPAGKRRWRLDLDLAEGANIALAVRSVGPRRGPIRQLEWDGRQLLVNGRWSIRADSGTIDAYLVNEEEPGWVTARPSRRTLAVRNGWAAARLELSRPGRYIFWVADTAPAAPVDRPLTTLPARTFP